MDVLDRETLGSLARHVGWPAVSVYSPMHRAGQDREQDPIRLRNLLKAAEDQVRSGGMRGSDTDELFARTNMLLADTSFFKQGIEGVALFVTPGATTFFTLDTPVSESLHVGDRFLIRPLTPALDAQRSYFVLALSKNHVRLIEGDRTGAREISLGSTPTSMADALKYDDPQKQSQFHSGTSAATASGGRRAAVFHGHGGLPETEKDNLVRFLRMVERGVREKLAGEREPLFLAGVDYVVAFYRELDSYPRTVDVTLSGNADELTNSEIHVRASEALGPLESSQLESDIAELQAMHGTGSASSDLNEIIPAAHEGRVKTLFVADNNSQWGTYDASSGSVIRHAERQSGDWDLTDLAAAETLLHGGTVRLLEPREDIAVPAAVFRY